MTRHLLLLALLLALALAAVVALAQQTEEAPPPPKPQVTFPDAFIVSTGTTIPFPGDVGLDPITQSGQIAFDFDAKRARIDHFWMGNRRSFIVDLAIERGYLLTNANCVTSRLVGKLLPMAVPANAVRDAEAALVRHVPVTHYKALERGLDGVVELDFFVRQQNLTAVLEDGSETSLSYTFPWRLETRRSDRREIADGPIKRPNWRFFGEKIEASLVPNFEHQVARVTRDTAVVVDYFDFVPMRPDPSMFEVPAQCRTAEYTTEFEHDVDVHDAQRHLTELSFNTEAGAKVFAEINAQARRRRIAASKASESSASATATEEYHHPHEDEVHVKDL